MSRVQPARAYDALYGAWGTRATPSRPTRATPRAPRGRFDRPSLTSSSTQRRIFADPVYTVSGARDHYREKATIRPIWRENVGFFSPALKKTVGT